jgi:signal transduction histidine kinase
MRFSTRIAKIIFSITALLLLVISTILYIQVRDLADVNNIVNHTSEVKLALSETLSYSKDVETSQRGFLLTKDSLFLQPYTSAFTRINSSIANLKNLITDNEEQKGNLKKLNALVKTRFGSVRNTINSYLSATNEIDRRQILLNEKSLMDSIRRQINKMEGLEVRLMGERQLRQTRLAFLAPLSTVFLVFFSLAVLVFSYYRITLDLKRSEIYVAQMKMLNAELLEKNRQLEITNEELDSFNYISSHDLQEPVRKIRTFISMIEETDFDKLSEKNKHSFRRIQVASIRIQELLHDLITYSQLNKKPVDFTDVDLNMVVENVKNKYSDKIKETGASINIEQLPIVKGNFFQLQQLFENLLSNSLKYRQAEIAPRIKMQYEIISKNKIDGDKTLTADRYYKISFIDNGIGFEQEQEHKVFDLFTKLHSREYAGTGIGLTICKKVVQNHNGLIKAKSKINDGTSFEIYLPLT